jgi:murein DD-endopeptidase MepM/ murein hydrolase activator NlpD
MTRLAIRLGERAEIVELPGDPAADRAADARARRAARRRRRRLMAGSAAAAVLAAGVWIGLAAPGTPVLRDVWAALDPVGLADVQAERDALAAERARIAAEREDLAVRSVRLAERADALAVRADRLSGALAVAREDSTATRGLADAALADADALAADYLRLRSDRDALAQRLRAVAEQAEEAERRAARADALAAALADARARPRPEDAQAIRALQDLVSDLADTLADETGRRMAEVERALRGLPLGPAAPHAPPPPPAPAAAAREGRGGPFHPVLLLPDRASLVPDGAEERLREYAERRRRLDRLCAAAVRVPFGNPVAEARLTSDFGIRRDPFNGRPARHFGVDLAAPTGTPVLSRAPGTVVRAGRVRAYGITVDVDHGNGITTRYAHLSRALVRPGDAVAAGDRVGLVGSTGRSTGPHLHYEVWIAGRPVDPARFMEANAHACEDRP